MSTSLPADFSQWKPESLVALSDREVRYANGFLRCNPLRWMGSVKAQWSSLLESQNLELKFLEIKTSLSTEFNHAQLWHASVNSFPIACGCDSSTLDAIFSLVSGNLRMAGRAVVLDYFGRRLLGTLAMSWNGPAFESFQFVRDAGPYQVEDWAASVQVRVEISGRQLSFCYFLSSYLLDVLDGMWIRQRLAAAKKQGELTLSLELGDLELSTAELQKLSGSGKVLPFNNVSFESVQLVSRTDNVVFGGRLVRLGNVFGVQILSGARSLPKPAESNSRLAFSLGQVKITAETYAEVSQPGALLKTEISLGSRVALVNAGIKYAEAVIAETDGRFVLVIV